MRFDIGSSYRSDSRVGDSGPHSGGELISGIDWVAGPIFRIGPNPPENKHLQLLTFFEFPTETPHFWVVAETSSLGYTTLICRGYSVN
jgi:hypothetical protein